MSEGKARRQPSQSERSPDDVKEPPMGKGCLEWGPDPRHHVSVNDGGNKCVYRAENPKEKHLSLYKVDGCLSLSSNGKRADFFLFVESEEKRVLILELKGRHINSAAKQIFKTIEVFRERLTAWKIVPRIIHRSHPDVGGNDLEKLKRAFPETRTLKSDQPERL